MEFCRNVFGITLLVITHKKSRAWFSLPGVILGYFWAHFDVCSNISWEMFDFFSWNFIQIFLVYILWQSTHYFFFSCLVLMEPILVYVPLFRENHSIFSHEILYRCFEHYSLMVTTIKCFYSNHLLLCWEPFLSIFGPIVSVYVSLILENPLVFSH